MALAPGGKLSRESPGETMSVLRPQLPQDDRHSFAPSMQLKLTRCDYAFLLLAGILQSIDI